MYEITTHYSIQHPGTVEQLGTAELGSNKISGEKPQVMGST